MATAVKERPILFSVEMVRAILDGRKTVTRRIIKPQPDSDFDGPEWYCPTRVDRHGEEYPGEPVFGIANTERGWPCPYGAPGHRLWLKEPYYYSAEHDNYYYAADNRGMGTKAYTRLSGRKPSGLRSIFLPRELSRITLEITGVRVERLQEISHDDVAAEGFPPDDSPPHDGTRLTAHGRRQVFAETWDQLNAKRGFPFASDPYVWVIEFVRR